MYRAAILNTFEKSKNKKVHPTPGKIKEQKLDILLACVRARFEQNHSDLLNLNELTDEALFRLIADSATVCADAEVKIQYLESTLRSNKI